MGHKLRRLINLSFSDCLTLLYVYTLLLLVEFGFHFFRFSTMVKLISLRCKSSETVRGIDPQRGLYLVTIALRHNFFKVKCLSKSFVLFRLLKKRGWAPILYIGIQKDRGFKAHAWVEIEGNPVLDSEARISAFKRIFELT